MSAEIIARESGLSEQRVLALIELLEAGATVPFIARYRKEATGSMDEVTILSVRDRHRALKALEERRRTVLSSLQEQGVLTEELTRKVSDAPSLAELEDLYLPYRPKRRTRATVARERGLDPPAQRLFSDPDGFRLEEADAYVGVEEGVTSREEVLEGVRDLIAERVQEDPEVRRSLRALFAKASRLTARRAPMRKGKDPDPEGRFADYYDWGEEGRSAPSHRILALFRGEEVGALTVHLLPPEERALEVIRRRFSPSASPGGRQLDLACQDSYRRLLAPSLETEAKRALKGRADETAAAVFGDNLRDLLLAPPLGQRPILAVDPGFRTGCKVVALDTLGELAEKATIYPLEPPREVEKAAGILRELLKRNRCEAVAVGNGTGGREAQRFLQGVTQLPVIMVSEAGASVYSASEVAREEFPEEDVTVRGAISIGRRLLDPLSELVKIDPKSIGVGQYQHDIPEKLLEGRLEESVLLCVNRVGVDLNRSSHHLLRHVSGLNEKSARSIVEYRRRHGPFRRREELLKVPGIGERSYEQAAGFLRIPDGENPLDASGVHPERYPLVERIASDLGTNPEALIGNRELLGTVEPKRYVGGGVGEVTVRDILEELRQPGRDPREPFEQFSFDESVGSIEDLEVGMRLPGIVTNVTNFGAFVDIGVHRDGLVHVSKLKDGYVADPREVVKVQQHVTVTVIDVDIKRKRINLSMIG
ncbi:MAG: Tex family protein [Alkalispirochaetaceae bacterium]